jgi:hypothetical protein
MSPQEHKVGRRFAAIFAADAASYPNEASRRNACSLRLHPSLWKVSVIVLAYTVQERPHTSSRGDRTRDAVITAWEALDETYKDYCW